MPDSGTPDLRGGRQAALILAGTGVFWIVATLAGRQFGLSNRTMALFDLAALAGFGVALWRTFQVWRQRRNDKG